MFDIGPRRTRPQGRFNLLVGLAIALAAAGAYVLGLAARTPTDPDLATVLLTLSPTLCLGALLIYVSRARASRDLPLSWAAAGLTICFVALTLQLISFPVVVADGGLLRTDPQSSAALYLLFHLGLVVGGFGGALRVTRRAIPAVTWVGILLSICVAANLVPLPTLLDDQVNFTPLLIIVEGLVTALSVAAAVLWSVRAGRTTTHLIGWFGVGLAVAGADVLLNAAADARYDPVWWSSLSMRVATFAVLATGALLHVLRDIRRMEGWTEDELTRRETQLAATAGVTASLMANAVALARASTPQEVAGILARSVTDLTGCRCVLVLEAGRGHRPMTTLTSLGYDADSIRGIDSVAAQVGSPALHLTRGGPSVYLSGHDDVIQRFPALLQIGAQQRVSRLSAVRMEAAGVLSGAVVASDDGSRKWSQEDRTVLEALVAQGGPALARARLQADEHQAAEVLQRSLLPSELTVPAGLSIAARYVPGDTHVRVGGDWYDCLPLPDGRVLLTVGDVMGKGVQAATVMGVLRQSIRVLATIDPSPAVVLGRLDEIGAELGDKAFATVVCALWDPSSGTARLSRAGHLPPLLIGADGQAVEVQDALSTPVGVRRGPRPEATISVPPGTYLVLYTDGLVERRHSPLTAGIDAVTLSTREGILAGSTMDAIADTLLTLSAGEDDIALLVIRFNDTSSDLAAQVAPIRQPDATTADTCAGSIPAAAPSTLLSST